MAVFISEPFLQDQECRQRASKIWDDSALSISREPSLLQRQPRNTGAAHNTARRVEEPPRGVTATPGAPALQETPAHILPSQSEAPHVTTALPRQDFKTLRALFPQDFHFVLSFSWFVHSWFFSIPTDSPIHPSFSNPPLTPMSGLPWMAIYTQLSFKHILTWKLTSKCLGKHKFHQLWTTPFTYRHSRQIRQILYWIFQNQLLLGALSHYYSPKPLRFFSLSWRLHSKAALQSQVTCEIWICADFRVLHAVRYFHMDTISASGLVKAWTKYFCKSCRFGCNRTCNQEGCSMQLFLWPAPHSRAVWEYTLSCLKGFNNWEAAAAKPGTHGAARCLFFHKDTDRKPAVWWCHIGGTYRERIGPGRQRKGSSRK